MLESWGIPSDQFYIQKVLLNLFNFQYLEDL